MAKKKKKAAPKKKPNTASLEARVRKLEKELRALAANKALQLGELLVLEKNRTCTTVKLKGNLQIVNGLGKTDTTNGCGNLIVGYNEPPPRSATWPSTRTGSHNLIVGRYHSHASYAGLLQGEMNLTTAAAPGSCVVGASEGSANSLRVAIVGGHEGKANSERCVVIGGFDNGANNAPGSVVVGGVNNRVDAPGTSIFGGGGNTAGGDGSTILGGSHLATTMPGERIP